MADLTDVFAHLDPEFSVPVDILGGLVVRPCPAVVLAQLFVEDETMAEAFMSPGIAYDSEHVHDLIVDPDGLRPLTIRLILACLPGVSEKVREKIEKAAAPIVVLLFQVALFASAVRGVGDLFPKQKKTTVANMPGVEEDHGAIASDIWKSACALKASGHDDAYRMSWTRLRFAEAVDAERGRDRLISTAVAGRIAQAEKKGWDKAMRDLGR
ncbi:hypothetical protein H9Q09_11915 [Aurantimonas sp. DM33-3]|uniref:hypothetical protein n=1 Tax=Aurantimonas TaxID=182269 RepID=UPI0016524CD3|nr:MULTISPECIES: hypothetical protein [Aurantimonas]MBC6716914.1 hypothetical protein [Aurantimonas sp. DM33-3]MCC4298441.1 hypothetical protein [Aurantimonas coralicida]